MLTYLAVKNFAIIDTIELDCADGMTVITGETGAGKSLLVDTLSLALGDRAESSMIKNGATRCEITAIFNLAQLPEASAWLKEHNFIDMDDSADVGANKSNSTELIIYRTFNKDGRSRSAINNIPCTLQMVKELGNFLVDIHGQHEHHSLLKTEVQRHLLDTYAQHESSCREIKNIFTAWQRLRKEYDALTAHTQDSAEKIEFFNYQLQELDNIASSVTKLEEIKKEHALLSSAEDIINNCEKVLAVIAEDNDTGNSGTILTQLHTAKNHLDKIQAKDARINNVCTLWESAIISLEESSNELANYLNHVELNQERLATLEAQLQKIHDVARKHKVKPEELLLLHERITAQLTALTTLDEKLAALREEITTCVTAYHKIADKVSATRQQAAATLSQLVTAKMHELGMPDGKFSIQITPLVNANNANKLTPYGMENVEFLVSANAGQPLQPLHKVASGGELSRISLALQVILASKATVPTLIFDEVDVGIGGKTAEIVGKLLRELGKSSQVICVTHLPQVASCGEHHLLAEKGKDAAHNSTALCVTALTTKQARIGEIARMLGGINITQRTIDHAREMLDACSDIF